MRPSRECYARAWAQLDGLEVHVGVECREGDDIEEVSDVCMDFLTIAFEITDDDPGVVTQLEGMVVHEWPDRAYFIETERAGRGTQVYQPFGMPQTPSEEYS